MESTQVERIVAALVRAAEHERLVPYQQFHALFNAGDPLTARYEALEQAVVSLCENSAPDYGVLLALCSGLPGDDFFRRFRKYRYDDFVAAMGATVHWRSIKRRRMLVDAERRRVYDDAKRRAALRVVQMA
ncbi:MAG TPA: hypothetical protein VN289_24740 [Paraburkholderia sp.]|nr:hypothetical protein [Paraburkholderia sp.]